MLKPYFSIFENESSIFAIKKGFPILIKSPNLTLIGLNCANSSKS